MDGAPGAADRRRGQDGEHPGAAVSQTLDTEALYAAARELTQSLYDLGAGTSWPPLAAGRLTAESLAGVRDQVPEAIAALERRSDGPRHGPTARLSGQR